MYISEKMDHRDLDIFFVYTNPLVYGTLVLIMDVLEHLNTDPCGDPSREGTTQGFPVKTPNLFPDLKLSFTLSLCVLT